MYSLKWFYHHVVLFDFIDSRLIQKIAQAVSGLILLFVLLNGALMLFPNNRFLPFHSIGEVPVGFMTTEEAEQAVAAYIEDTINKDITIDFDGEETVTTTYEVLGLTVDTQAIIQQDINSQQSGFWPVSRIKETYTNGAITTTFNPQKIEAFLEPYETKYALEPVGAAVELQNGAAVIVEHQNGRQLEIEVVSETISAAVTEELSSVTVPFTQIVPARTTAEVEPFKDAIIKTTESLVRVEGPTGSTTANSTQILSWMMIEDREVEGLSLAYDFAAVAGFVGDFSAQFYQASQPSVVTIVDDQETGRTPGVSGVGTNDGAIVNQIISGLQAGQPTIELTLSEVELKPETTYKRSYSSTNVGLGKLIEDWTKDHSGTYGVMVTEIGGQGRQAGYNANKSFVTASTYKMFLAYALLKEVENGDLKLTDKAGYASHSVKDCIDEMILRSTNFCSVPLGWKIGWDRTDELLAEAGFVATKLNNYNSAKQLSGDKRSTAAEEALFLRKLNNGELLNGSNTGYLLGLLKNQIHRKGIPSGVPGVVVADKVGFLEGYTHDVGIVYSDDATYVISIMSLWGSWGQFADLSTRVHDYFN